ncbi:GPI ethanolamine phosphate transferase 2 isoform X6 [Passer montanus]|uniref:GPI ethanolamine phosphate transferase 2 isoform X6 n=1 Tax=Passer montanus TaxID=9160 RepID=UPI0019602877|nr:GPI ethanolamine phosphate transferase 2 isoform X6 [Passer montanus]
MEPPFRSRRGRRGQDAGWDEGLERTMRIWFTGAGRGSGKRGLESRDEIRNGTCAPEANGGGMVSNWTKIPPPLFKKVVIVLIDALRDDFVFGSKGKQFMPYTTQVVEKGTSYSFIAEAKPPTVTMPRIKALMTGSIPGFIDVVVNLNSPALLDDNLIWQAKTAGKRIIFYGDDTWVKLFPKHFVEYDGTTSFFVSDFTEVDDNVTRHLDRVLKREDWDLLILHYLGLDHIGHMTGPNSPLVGPKLREMDNILKKIHISLLSKEEASLPNLLVVCGDHGMSETGSHGGSSEGEVHTPLLFISSAFGKRSAPLAQPEHVQQTDLASTLAIGLGLPISRNSVGNLILPVVGGKTMREQLRFAHLNGFQLSRLLQENTPAYEKDPGYEHFKIAEKSHGNWIKLYLEGNNSEILLNLGKKVLKQYLEALKTLSSSLSKQVAQYDMYSMMVGTVIIMEVLILLLLSVPKALSKQAEFEVPLSPPLFSLLFYLMCLMLCAVHVIVCTSAESLCYFCSMSWLTAVGVMMLISALMCGILSAIAKIFENYRLPPKGNSNGIATVDISAGFVGLDSYVEIPAIFLTAFATYAGPFLWAIHLLCYLSSEVSRNSAAVGHGCFCYALMRSIPVAIYVVLVTGLRYHLFIWSVFSPKLLYEGVHVFITAAVCLFFTAMDQNHAYRVQD